MAQSNLERVGRALELLNKGLKPFVERKMLAKYGSRWQYEALKSLREQHFTDDDDLYLDTQGLLLIMQDQWNDVFYRVLGNAERSLVSELRDTRNKWAHQKAFNTDDLFNPFLMAKDGGVVMEEVVKHLTGLVGAKVNVTLEIEAEIPGGIAESTVRTILENCSALKFKNPAFEVEQVREVWARFEDRGKHEDRGKPSPYYI